MYIAKGFDTGIVYGCKETKIELMRALNNEYGWIKKEKETVRGYVYPEPLQVEQVSENYKPIQLKGIKEVCRLTIDRDWIENSETVAKVQKLIGQAEDQTRQEQKLPPLEVLDFEKFTSDNFLYLKRLGYTVKEIRAACDVSRSTFDLWIKENKLSRIFITKSMLEAMSINESAKQLPFKEEMEMVK
ncbi:hypothetical protein [Melissococcus plutonius]|nr:hypothetical protein [Melissococcus plutonius]KMT33301.1 hypothetical protein MEPL6_1c03360 [Melissococcus plutonius]KMT33647.1 hypothetical protein MEPL8_7c00850 [Melissococcus plutonius]BBD15627.1 hypothetical protein DAT585_1330 [Melissococcus plutonius]